MPILAGMLGSGSRMAPFPPAALAMAVLSACAAAGCGRPQPPPEPRDVLLVTIDTARADRFSYTGAPGPGTPRIDALARDGAGFVDAITPAPLTKPAHASLMTGRLPPSHTVRDNGAYRLPEAETTLAEVLQGAGFTTGGVHRVRGPGRALRLQPGIRDVRRQDPGAERLGLPRLPGEDGVKTSRPPRCAGSMRTPAGGPLAWFHLSDPHAPYRPPEPERSRYESAYDGEIAYVDRVVGGLLDAWQARRGGDRTLVVVTADHGESLDEHEEPTHGVLVYDATIRVPLVIRAPGIRLKRPIEAPVSLIDVLPTILGLLHLPCPAGCKDAI